MEDNEKISIGFRFTDEFHNSFASDSTVGVFYEFGESKLTEIGRYFNLFLRQCGFYRENELMLMESLSEDEYDAVICFLDKYRADHSETESDAR